MNLVRGAKIVISGAAYARGMAGLRDAGRLVLFVAGGIAAVIVGAFMIRGTMHMWDGPDGDAKKKD